MVLNLGESGIFAVLNLGESGIFAVLNLGESGIFVVSNLGESGRLAVLKLGESGRLSIFVLKSAIFLSLRAATVGSRHQSKITSYNEELYIHIAIVTRLFRRLHAPQA